MDKSAKSHISDSLGADKKDTEMRTARDGVLHLVKQIDYIGENCGSNWKEAQNS